MTSPAQNLSENSPVENRSTCADPAASSAWWLSAATAKFLALALLLVGIEAWLILGHGYYGHRHQVLLLACAGVLGLLPSIRRGVNRFWCAIDRAGLGRRLVLALALAVASSFYLYCTARDEGVGLDLKYQDEFSYLIQMRMLAEGRLFLPAHPRAEFFDTAYVLSQPVYASMYFPGTALMYVPALWLHLPPYAGPLAASGLSVGALFLVVAEILDVGSGLLAVLLLLSMEWFRMDSIMLLSQPPVLCLGLIMTFAWLRWWRNWQGGWAMLMGAAAGWAAITRPADALCFAVVLIVATAWDLRLRPARAWARSAVIILLAAMPFFLLQLKFNRDVTGQWFKTPFTLYSEQFYPGLQFGFGDNPQPGRHVSDLPQKQLLYDNFVREFSKKPRHWSDIPDLFMQRLQYLLARGLLDSIAFLWIIAPLSLLAFWDRRFWVVWGILPCFLLVYTGYSFFFPHYMTTILPAVVFMLVLPIRALTDIFPAQQAIIRTWLGLAIVGLSLAVLPQFDRTIFDQRLQPVELRAILERLSTDVTPPAVVMFHFGSADGERVETEPVYNVDVAWPDDAPMVRAHDLNSNVSAVGKRGDRDRPLYEYYLNTDPRRVFYLYDRNGGAGRLTRLGSAAEMMDKTQ